MATQERKAVFIAPEVHEQLKAIAERDMRTLSAEIAYLIAFYESNHS